MSYILDALRKADAERERDPARGIHAQPLGTLPTMSRRGIDPLHVAAMAAGAAVLAAVVWLWIQPVAPGVVSAVPVVAAPVPAPVVLPPAPAVEVAPPPVPVPAAPRPTAAKRQERKPAPANEVTAAAVAAPAATPPADARILPASDIPPDFPKLAITGGVYSDNPSQRMLLVNGQVVKEGAVFTPDMVLESIRAKNAVIRVRGIRYSIPY